MPLIGTWRTNHPSPSGAIHSAGSRTAARAPSRKPGAIGTSAATTMRSAASVSAGSGRSRIASYSNPLTSAYGRAVSASHVPTSAIGMPMPIAISDGLQRSPRMNTSFSS